MPGPAGIRLKEGHATLVTLANAPSIKLWEQEITPPGFDAGGPNDTTTMRTTRWRTRQPKVLITMTPMSGVFQYDPAVIADIVNQLGKNQQITVTYPTGQSWTFYGWINRFTPHRIVEGQPPLADVDFEAANEDTAGVETGPSYGAASTTTATTTTTLT